ncbi:MAG: beta-ketoacyl-ACP reductase [Anaerolineales bacterium]|nr:beta-ketoacyl-ACP reductase [Anaerolineales bacterium]
MRLQDRTAIITGAANGIGRATARCFVAQGSRVAIWDMDQEAGLALETELGTASASYQPVDVTDPDAVEAATAQVHKALGRIDILVNNAGILHDAQLVKYKDGEILSRMSLKHFDEVIGVNLRGTFITTRAVAPYMIRQGYGRILNTSSIVGLYGNFGQTNYVASKAGIIGMTRVWARELGRYNITANVVTPGFIETDMVAHMPPKILEMMIQRTPLKRLGKPEEIANVFLFLASDEASFINGAVICADGGTVVGT